MTRLRALTLGCVALALAAYVIPGDRVVREVARVRASAVPLRVEAQLEDVAPDEQRALVIELHPSHGARIQDDRGARWLPRAGEVLAPAGVDIPVWIPPADVLALAREDLLLAWLSGAGVNLSWSRLARCGDVDCIALGEAEARAQLWVDKDRFEVRRVSLAAGRSVGFEGWRDWAGRRFPERMRAAESDAPLGTLRVTAVRAAPELSRADFSEAWLR